MCEGIYRAFQRAMRGQGAMHQGTMAYLISWGLQIECEGTDSVTAHPIRELMKVQG